MIKSLKGQVSINSFFYRQTASVALSECEFKPPLAVIAKVTADRKLLPGDLNFVGMVAFHLVDRDDK
jgi:hypothetical protein